MVEGQVNKFYMLISDIENEYTITKNELVNVQARLKDSEERNKLLEETVSELSSVSAIVTAKNMVIKVELENRLLHNKISYLQNVLSDERKKKRISIQQLDDDSHMKNHSEYIIKTPTMNTYVEHQETHLRKDDEVIQQEERDEEERDEEERDEEELELYEFTWKKKIYYIDEHDIIYERHSDSSVGDEIGKLETTLKDGTKKKNQSGKNKLKHDIFIKLRIIIITTGK